MTGPAMKFFDPRIFGNKITGTQYFNYSRSNTGFWTFTFWVYFDSNLNALIFNISGDNGSIQINNTALGVVYATGTDDSDGVLLTETKTVATAGWYFFCLTRDNVDGSIKLYYAAESNVSLTLFGYISGQNAANLGSGNYAFQFGSTAARCSFFDIKSWSQSLTSAQALAEKNKYSKALSTNFYDQWQMKYGVNGVSVSGTHNLTVTGTPVKGPFAPLIAA